MVIVHSVYMINVLKDEGPDVVMCLLGVSQEDQGCESCTSLLPIKEWQSKKNSK